MEFEIIDESGNGRFVTKTFGQFSTENMTLMLKQLVSHNHWKKGLDLLMDHRQLSLDEATVDEVSQLAKVIGALEKDFAAGRCAMVVPDKGPGIAAIFKYAIDLKSEMVIKMFEPAEYRNALNWLENDF